MPAPPSTFARLQAMRSYDSKILGTEALASERAHLRQAGKILVFTNGCFDILHTGHVDYLAFARSQGDALAVGINSDASVKRNKGVKRPIIPQEERARMLASLECVDYVTIFDTPEPLDLIRAVLPDVLVKGSDWAHYVAGRDIVEAAGGRIALAQLTPGWSTTEIIRRIRDAYSDES